jgi:hypothetical protein
MTKTIKSTKGLRLLRTASMALCLLPVALGACGGDDDDNVGAGADGGDVIVDTDAGGEVATLCNTYCDLMTETCTGDNVQYVDTNDCVSFCESAGWPDGEEGDISGNTLQCRIYHAEVAAGAEPAEHCPHAGSTGDGVCGATVTFRTDAPSSYLRVDRMGMPAVSTVLISSAMKNAYNDADPSDDADLTFLNELAGQLTALHGALDDDFAGLNLSTCSMVETVNGLPECFGQEIAPGVSVASLAVPDTLHINPANQAGFPNGRMLTDPVIDVTLGVLFLEMGASCGAAACSPTTLASPPLNPPANDVAFDTAFPYLAVPHQP